MTLYNAVRRRRSESGETLIEALIAVLILSTSFIACVTLMVTVVGASAANRQQVDAGNRATDVAEALQRRPYIACSPGNPPNYNPSNSVFNPDDGKYTAQIESIRYLASGAAATESATFQANCPATDQGAQQITVYVRAKATPQGAARVVIVKRKDACVGVPTTAGQRC